MTSSPEQEYECDVRVTGTGPMGSVVLIDDDELTLKLSILIAADAGFECTGCESGEKALRHLAVLPTMPLAVVADLQMPGLCGNLLAQRLREMCGPATRLVAMSGSTVSPVSLAEFDGFLLKPFKAGDLLAALEGGVPAAEDDASDVPMLNGAVYDNLNRSMHPEQVRGLYKMCLHDAATRIDTMRKAIGKRDQATYRRAAHAIKGGCGMVGANELAALAGAMEVEGLPAEGSTRLESFQTASERLRRMLESKANGT